MGETTGPQMARRPRPASLPATLGAAAWGLALFASIGVVGVRLRGHLAGRAILCLISAGFLLFAIARSTVDPRSAPACASPLLAPPMRILYWTGYALMLSGVLLAAGASLAGLSA